MRTTPMIEKAKAFATEAHKGQKRKTGEDFITHPEMVAKLTSEHTSAETAIAAAWLHDTVEDCGVSLETITIEFGEQVAEIVALLTRKEGQGYYEFIMQLKGNPAARLVKVADMTHNLSTWKEEGSLKDKWKLGRELILSWDCIGTAETWDKVVRELTEKA